MALIIRHTESQVLRLVCVSTPELSAGWSTQISKGLQNHVADFQILPNVSTEKWGSHRDNLLRLEEPATHTWHFNSAVLLHCFSNNISKRKAPPFGSSWTKVGVPGGSTASSLFLTILFHSKLLKFCLSVFKLIPRFIAMVQCLHGECPPPRDHLFLFFLYFIGQRETEWGRQKKDTYSSTALPLVTLPPAGENGGLKPSSLHTE